MNEDEIVIKEIEDKIISEEVPDLYLITNCIFVGDSSVGKTTLINLLLNKEEIPKHTEGIIIKDKYYKINENYVKLKINDSSGDEKFKELTQIQLKEAKIIVYIYDVTNKKSFDNIKNWINFAEKTDSIGQYKVLIGNKTDLSDKREVDTETAKNFAERFVLTLYEVSMNEKEQIKKLFEKILIDIYLNENKKNIDKEKNDDFWKVVDINGKEDSDDSEDEDSKDNVKKDREDNMDSADYEDSGDSNDNKDNKKMDNEDSEDIKQDVKKGKESKKSDYCWG